MNIPRLADIIDNYSSEQNVESWIEIACPVAAIFIVVAFLFPEAAAFFLTSLHLKSYPLFNIFLKLILTQLILFIPPFAVMMFINRNASLLVKMKISNFSFKYVKIAFFTEALIFFPILVIALIMFVLLSYFGITPGSPIIELLKNAPNGSILVLFVVSVIVAPIVEEYVFRVIIFGFIEKMFGALPALILTSFVFAVLHGGFVQLVPLFFLAVVLQLLYMKYKSLYPSMFLHMLHNLIIMILFVAIKPI